MAPTMKRKTDYIFQRPGSPFWQLKLQSPDGRREISLRTTDRAQAEILALPMVLEHKQKLLDRRPKLVPVWEHELEPGKTHDGPDGGKIVATDQQLIYLDAAGAIVDTKANGRSGYTFTGPRPFTVRGLAQATLDADLGEGPAPRIAPATRDDDDKLIDKYIEHAALAPRQAREALATWAIFRELCPKVRLINATRDDGRKLAAHLQSQGNKSATVQKKINWLTAAVNFAIKEGRLKFNPFSGVVANTKDALRRLPFDDADMQLIRDNLAKLSPSDQLMVRVLGTTGMRLGEVFQIDGEAIERDVRFVTVGSKTEQSLRRVPLPKDLLSHLPATIRGRLFPDDDTKCASARLHKWLRKIGIADPAKVMHSFRHRAQDRLRAAECPSDIRHAILGHEDRSIAEGYGEGFAVPVLKKWIDRIGF